ncbi:MAG TPA: ABC transporter ATP-binding protein [Nocardioidaceae bacterium]|nr:ABC transporter ATP-binding protein [Nocardioidaceae bacterium]
MSQSTTAAAEPADVATGTGEGRRPVTVRVSDLRVTIPTAASLVRPTDGVSIDVRKGEILGIVGESGSGKTVTCRAMLGLLPTAKTTATGSVSYPGRGVDDVLGLSPKQLRKHWGSFASMIPQNPMTSLNPVHRIGDQIQEAVAARSRLPKREQRDRVVELMRQVGIPAPERRLRAYPHEFSGGMLQRTLIAIALAGDPEFLVADEPTTALDVIIQDQILATLLELQRSRGMSLVLVSHDLGVIAQTCDRVGVMYAGQLVELAETRQLLAAPQHPYTSALLQSMPSAVPPDQELASITGAPPRLVGMSEVGCRFAPRCEFAEEACSQWPTELLAVGSKQAREVRCRRHAELVLTGESSMQ